ncbi:MAG: SlyX family protein [Myxococcaceae bacterium]
MEDRIVELEIRFTEQQHMLQELSEVVYAQQRAIDLLTAEVRLLRQKVPEPGIVDAAEREKPPHY